MKLLKLATYYCYYCFAAKKFLATKKHKRHIKDGLSFYVPFVPFCGHFTRYI